MADDSTECRSHYATVRLPLNVASIPDTVRPTPLQIRGESGVRGEINELHGVFPNPATDAVSVDVRLASPGPCDLHVVNPGDSVSGISSGCTTYFDCHS